MWSILFLFQIHSLCRSNHLRTAIPMEPRTENVTINEAVSPTDTDLSSMNRIGSSTSQSLEQRPIPIHSQSKYQSQSLDDIHHSDHHILTESILSNQRRPDSIRNHDHIVCSLSLLPEPPYTLIEHQHTEMDAE